MKKTVKILALALALTTVLTGCKKGEDDPLISFRSRKARVANDWEMKSGTHVSNYSFTNGNNTNAGTSNVIYTGNTYNETSSSTFNNITTTDTETGTYSAKMSFDKDGTFEWQTIQDGDISVIKGTWNFTGKVGDRKNKEQIVLTLTSIVESGNSTNYTGNQTVATFDLKELRNDRMVIVSEENNTSSNGISNSKDEFILE